jgi:hypothetical protein
LVDKLLLLAGLVLSRLLARLTSTPYLARSLPLAKECIQSNVSRSEGMSGLNLAVSSCYDAARFSCIRANPRRQLCTIQSSEVRETRPGSVTDINCRAIDGNLRLGHTSGPPFVLRTWGKVRTRKLNDGGGMDEAAKRWDAERRPGAFDAWTSSISRQQTENHM